MKIKIVKRYCFCDCGCIEYAQKKDWMCIKCAGGNHWRDLETEYYLSLDDEYFKLVIGEPNTWMEDQLADPENNKPEVMNQ